jgi:hypothetical protein
MISAPKEYTGPKYFVDASEGTQEFHHPDFRTIKVSKDGKFGLVHKTGEWVKITRTVNYKKNPSKHECDARCMTASGRTMNCECACGGANHGKNGIRV